MSSLRLRRLVPPSPLPGSTGRGFLVALDHGLFAVPDDLPPIEDLAAVLATVGAVEPDGVLMSAGQAGLLAELPGRLPALTVRADVTNLYLSPPQARSVLFDDVVERAVRADAAAVLVNLLDADDDPGVRIDCLANIAALKSRCDQCGMPLMVEPIPFERRDGRYVDVADEARLVPLVRQAVEAGADVIKAGMLAADGSMRRAIRVAGGRPYLARGGSKGDDHDVLAATRRLMDCGGAGIVFGRNIFQHANPKGMAAALKAIIHDDASVDAAAGLAAG